MFDTTAIKTIRTRKTNGRADVGHISGSFRVTKGECYLYLGFSQYAANLFFSKRDIDNLRFVLAVDDDFAYLVEDPDGFRLSKARKDKRLRVGVRDVDIEELPIEYEARLQDDGCRVAVDGKVMNIGEKPIVIKLEIKENN